MEADEQGSYAEAEFGRGVVHGEYGTMVDVEADAEIHETDAEVSTGVVT